MKMIFFFSVIILFSCDIDFNGIKRAKSGNDNSHLRAPQYPNENKTGLLTPDSIVSNGIVLYRIDRGLKLNDMLVCDSFYLEKCYESIGKPDSIHRGGPEIIAEFGVDDFDIFMGESILNTGHGQILHFEIQDEHLKLADIGLGMKREEFEQSLGFDFPNKDTISCLGICDGVYTFQFEKGTVVAINYYAAPL